MSKILWGLVEVPNVKQITIDVIKLLWRYSKIFKIDAILLLLTIVLTAYWIITDCDISGVVAIMMVYVFGVIIRLGKMIDTINTLNARNSTNSSYKTDINN